MKNDEILKLAVEWYINLHGGASENTISTALAIVITKANKKTRNKILNRLTKCKSFLRGDVVNISNVSTAGWMHQNGKKIRPDLWLWDQNDDEVWPVIEQCNNKKEVKNKIKEIKPLAAIPKSILLEIKWDQEGQNRDRIKLRYFRDDFVKTNPIRLSSDEFSRIVEIAKAHKNKDQIYKFALSYLKIYLDHKILLKYLEWPKLGTTDCALWCLELVFRLDWEKDKNNDMKFWNKISLPKRKIKVGGLQVKKLNDLGSSKTFEIKPGNNNTKRLVGKILTHFKKHHSKIGAMSIQKKLNDNEIIEVTFWTKNGSSYKL